MRHLHGLQYFQTLRKYYSGRDKGKPTQGKLAANLPLTNNFLKTKRNSESTTKCIAFELLLVLPQVCGHFPYLSPKTAVGGRNLSECSNTI